MVKVGGQIIACVELTWDSYFSTLNFKIPDRTLYTLEWVSGKSKSKMHSLAFTTDNQFSFPHTNFVMALKDPALLERLSKFAVEPNDVNDAPSYEVIMSLVKNSE